MRRLPLIAAVASLLRGRRYVHEEHAVRSVEQVPQAVAPQARATPQARAPQAVAPHRSAGQDGAVESAHQGNCAPAARNPAGWSRAAPPVTANVPEELPPTGRPQAVTNPPRRVVTAARGAGPSVCLPPAHALGPGSSAIKPRHSPRAGGQAGGRVTVGDLRLYQIRRAEASECFARDLEPPGRARARCPVFRRCPVGAAAPGRGQPLEHSVLTGDPHARITLHGSAPTDR